MNQSHQLTPSRKDIRVLLGSIISGAALGYQKIYTYQADDLQGQSPVLRIMSSGSQRPRRTFQGSFAIFGITLQSLVLYKDGQGDHTIWTPEDAEAKLDELEKSISATLFSYDFSDTGIKTIEQPSMSRIRKDVVQGKTYLIEYIPLLVEAFYG